MLEKKKVVVSKCKASKVKEAVTQKRFQEIVQTRNASRVENDVEGLWTGLRGCLLEAADMVCFRTKGPPRLKETWWWNDEMSKAVGEKQRLFTVWRKDKTDENFVQYNIAKRLSKKGGARCERSWEKRVCEEVAYGG